MKNQMIELKADEVLHYYKNYNHIIFD
jgi:hypothetical protein